MRHDGEGREGVLGGGGGVPAVRHGEPLLHGGDAGEDRLRHHESPGLAGQISGLRGREPGPDLRGQGTGLQRGGLLFRQGRLSGGLADRAGASGVGGGGDAADRSGDVSLYGEDRGDDLQRRGGAPAQAEAPVRQRADREAAPGEGGEG